MTDSVFSDVRIIKLPSRLGNYILLLSSSNFLNKLDLEEWGICEIINLDVPFIFAKVSFAFEHFFWDGVMINIVKTGTT